MELLMWLRIQWDRALAVAGFTLGVLMLLVGWIQVSDTPFVADQMAYVVSAGLGGLVAVGIGGVLWISADLRDEWRKLDRLEELLAAHESSLDPAAALLDLTQRVDELEARGAGVPAAVPPRSRRNGQRQIAAPATAEDAS